MSQIDILNAKKIPCMHTLVRILMPTDNQVHLFDEKVMVSCPDCGEIMSIGDLGAFRASQAQSLRNKVGLLGQKLQEEGLTMSEAQYMEIANEHSTPLALAKKMDNLIKFDKGIKFPVVEVFSSYQGEGAMMGMKCTFVRLQGCNLACPWCDTPNSLDTKATEGVTNMSFNELLMAIQELGNSYVIFTGGEPTINNGLHAMAKLLTENGFAVGLETNGTGTAICQEPFFAHVAISPKPPYYIIHPDAMASEIKLVASEELTLDVVLQITSTLMQVHWKGVIWLQPEANDPVASMHLIDVIMEELQERYGKAAEFVRVGIQAHKYWGVR